MGPWCNPDSTLGFGIMVKPGNRGSNPRGLIYLSSIARKLLSEVSEPKVTKITNFRDS